MSNKTKYAPLPPIDTTIDFIIGTTEVLKPKRGRKRTKKKQYFTPDTDRAIAEYLSTSIKKKETIYSLQEYITPFTN